MASERTENRRRVIRGAALLAGIGAAAGLLLGASAFFTDREETVKSVRAGRLSMECTDLTDLDGTYRSYAEDPQTGMVTASDLITSGEQTLDFALPTALDAANPSTGIVNPGDAGIYAIRVENTGEKSIDAAALVTVRVALAESAVEPDGWTPAALTAANTADKTYALYAVPGETESGLVAQVPLEVADCDAYTIEGLGRPAVTYAEDGKSMTLTYCADFGILDGSVETDNATPRLGRTYAGMAGLSRLAKDKFMGASFTVTTEVFAKQHRNTFGSFAHVDENGVLVPATGDWTGMASFEQAAGN